MIWRPWQATIIFQDVFTYAVVSDPIERKSWEIKALKLADRQEA